MKHNTMLTLTSLLSLLLLTFHLTDDIVHGWEPGGLANLFGVVIISGVWLCGALMLRERLAGRIIMLLGALLSLFVPYIHMSGKGVGALSRVAGKPGYHFFVWTLLALGVLGLFSAILSVRGMWDLRGRKKQGR